MNRPITFALLLLAALSLQAADTRAIGLRGSMWGELRYDIPKDFDDNLLLNGWIKQGIDWQRWGNTTVNTYATLRYKLDTQKYDWNNTIGPGVGVSLDMYSPKGIILTIGAEYLWERQIYDGDVTYQKTVIYLSWVGWWDLKGE